MNHEEFLFFELPDMPEEKFTVLEFSGFEELSRCYRFEIELACLNHGLDLDLVLDSQARLSLGLQNVFWNGMLAEFEQLQQFGKYTLYRAVLVPRLWRLCLTTHNQVFTDKTIPEIINLLLLDGGLGADDFELRLTGRYQPREYVCQFRQTHLEFIQYQMERYGIYYFFEQSPGQDKLIITDSQLSHSRLPDNLSYYPVSGLDYLQQQIVQKFVSRQRLVPGSVQLVDYNYRRPDLRLKVQAEVDHQGMGQLNFYGDHFQTRQEGLDLAELRAQELKCRQQDFSGTSLSPALRPGTVFGLENYFEERFNQDYLITSCLHRGQQSAALLDGIDIQISERSGQNSYFNDFSCISNDIQFRPALRTPASRFYGTLNAHIDATGSGQYAELDAHGRYKIRLPFDSGEKGGKGSAWIRMMQPYTGRNHGLHCPLHKGTEVMLVFVEGNPDRPVIAGAVPNPLAPSEVNRSTRSMCKLTTGGGNKLHIEDKAGGERILLHTPTQTSWLRLGEPNDPAGNDSNPYFKPDKDKSGANKSGFALNSSGSMGYWVGTSWKLQVGGVSFTNIGGGMEDIYLGFNSKFVLGWESKLVLGWEHKIQGMTTIFAGSNTELSEQETRIAELTSELSDINTELVDANTSLAEEKTSLTQTQTRVSDTDNQLGEAKTSLDDKKNELNQTKTELNQARTELSETNTALRQASTRLGQTRTRLSETKNGLSQAKTDLNDAHTIITETETSLNGTSNHVSDLHLTM